MKNTLVVCGIIWKDGHVLCCQRSKKMKNPHLWEFPGGKCEGSETLESALRRELLEELNLEVIIEGLFMRTIYPPQKIELIAFHCHLEKVETLELREHSAFRWLNPESLAKLQWSPADIPIVKKLMSD